MKMSWNCVLGGLAVLALAGGSLLTAGSSWAQQQVADAGSPATAAGGPAIDAADGAAQAPQSSSGAQSSAPAAQTNTPPATQTPAASAGAPQPLSMPSCSAPLQTAVPHTFDAGPFGSLAITGILSGMGMSQNNWMAGDKATMWDVSNAQVFIQKTTGWWQFYLQGGAYNLPDLGVPYLSTAKTINNFYGPFPQGYLKLVKGNFSVEGGALPTLIGGEYTFSFENMNIERGILWNQENAVNRGVQFNYAYKKITAALSWNDGFYSNRYTWLWGSLSYAFNTANSLAFVGGGNFSQTRFQTAATPVQNNEQIYNLIYTYSHEAWMIEPYFQFTDVPANSKAGIAHGAATSGGALLMNYNFKHGYSLAFRPEYLKSTGSLAQGSLNLMYGPGSGAFAFTVTPAWQKAGFFIRGELGFVKATNMTAGAGFGTSGAQDTQVRGAIESGFMF